MSLPVIAEILRNLRTSRFLLCYNSSYTTVKIQVQSWVEAHTEYRQYVAVSWSINQVQHSSCLRLSWPKYVFIMDTSCSNLKLCFHLCSLLRANLVQSMQWMKYVSTVDTFCLNLKLCFLSTACIEHAVCVFNEYFLFNPYPLSCVCKEYAVEGSEKIFH